MAARGIDRALSVVVAHEDALPRDIVAHACAQRHNLRVVRCIASGGEIMTSCVSSPPDVVVASDSISEQFDEVVDALLAVGTRVVVICTNPSLERVIHLLELGVQGVMLDDSSPLEIATGVGGGTRRNGAGPDCRRTGAALVLIQEGSRSQRRPGRGGPHTRGSEVLEAMVEGLSTKAIARQLGVRSRPSRTTRSGSSKSCRSEPTPMR